MEWDDNKDGKISWIEALDEFSKIFHGIVKDNRDHWVRILIYLFIYYYHFNYNYLLLLFIIIYRLV